MFEGVTWLFFDVGSTLVDERRAYERRLREIAAAAGASYEEVLRVAMTYYEKNGRGDHDAAAYYGVPLPAWHKEEEEPYADAAEVLAALHGRFHIGVIANQSPGTAERLCQYGLMPYIDLVVASAEEGVSKPDRRIFERALTRAGCTPVQAVMVGDRIDNDIVPARAIGMRTIRIMQGYGQYTVSRGAHEQPDMTAASLTEVRALLMSEQV